MDLPAGCAPACPAPQNAKLGALSRSSQPENSKNLELREEVACGKAKVAASAASPGFSRRLGTAFCAGALWLQGAASSACAVPHEMRKAPRPLGAGLLSSP